MKRFLSSNWTLVVGTVFIFLGLFLLLVFPPGTLLAKLFVGFVTEIGFALLIAWGVAAIVERGAREEYDRYTQEKALVISRNVFGYLYNVRFPRNVFSTIEEYVFKIPVIKTQQRLDYHLLEPEDSSGWMRMKCEFDYVLKNISDHIVNHPIRFHVSEVSGASQPELGGVGLQSLVVGGEMIPSSMFPVLDKASQDHVGEKRYELVRSIPPDGELRVRVTFIQAKRVEDNDLWTSNSVCQNLELKFRYDPSVYNAFVIPVHPSNRFDTDIPPNGGSNCRTVTIDSALLPKNGVFMWWNLRQGAPGSVQSKVTTETSTLPLAASRL
jgi:uncharacterized membrane protein (DUF485 family)